MLARHKWKAGAIIAGAGLCGGSDCVIITEEEPGPTGIRILHAIESLAYRPHGGDQKVLIWVDFVLVHEGTKPARIRIVHRGKTGASLVKFSLGGGNDPRQRILRELYADWIEPTSDGKLDFYERVNCYGRAPTPIRLSTAGPGDCFADGQVEMPLTAEIESPHPYQAYSSYLIPPRASRKKIQPGEKVIWRVRIDIAGESYRHLVRDGSEISVDSYTRLLRDIENVDLPNEKDERLIEHFHSKIQRDSAVICPKAYDIVIFQQEEIGQPVELKSGSISITPARIGKELAGKVLWFLGQPDEFYLKFRYPEHVIAQERRRIKKELGICG